MGFGGAMMKRLALALTAAFLAPLASCQRPVNTRADHLVEYYREHPDEMNKALKKCGLSNVPEVEERCAAAGQVAVEQARARAAAEDASEAATNSGPTPSNRPGSPDS
jgi:hypothetical protein